LPREIRVNAVSPGLIETQILGKVMSGHVAAEMSVQLHERNPMKPFSVVRGDPKSVAFLAFEATDTTGAELAVDGGLSQL